MDADEKKLATIYCATTSVTTIITNTTNTRTDKRVGNSASSVLREYRMNRSSSCSSNNINNNDNRVNNNNLRSGEVDRFKRLYGTRSVSEGPALVRPFFKKSSSIVQSTSLINDKSDKTEQIDGRLTTVAKSNTSPSTSTTIVASSTVDQRSSFVSISTSRALIKKNSIDQGTGNNVIDTIKSLSSTSSYDTGNEATVHKQGNQRKNIAIRNKSTLAISTQQPDKLIDKSDLENKSSRINFPSATTASTSVTNNKVFRPTATPGIISTTATTSIIGLTAKPLTVKRNSSALKLGVSSSFTPSPVTSAQQHPSYLPVLLRRPTLTADCASVRNDKRDVKTRLDNDRSKSKKIHRIADNDTDNDKGNVNDNSNENGDRRILKRVLVCHNARVDFASCRSHIPRRSKTVPLSGRDRKSSSSVEEKIVVVQRNSKNNRFPNKNLFSSENESIVEKAQEDESTVEMADKPELIVKENNYGIDNNTNRKTSSTTDEMIDDDNTTGEPFGIDIIINNNNGNNDFKEEVNDDYVKRSYRESVERQQFTDDKSTVRNNRVRETERLMRIKRQSRFKAGPAKEVPEGTENVYDTIAFLALTRSLTNRLDFTAANKCLDSLEHLSCDYVRSSADVVRPIITTTPISHGSSDSFSCVDNDNDDNRMNEIRRYDDDTSSRKVNFYIGSDSDDDYYSVDVTPCDSRTNVYDRNYGSSSGSIHSVASSSFYSVSPIGSSILDDFNEEPIACSPNGRYLKFKVEIGSGSFKTVFKGLDTQTGVSVAWCELQESKVSKADRSKFRIEAEMLKRLEHPNIVRFFDYWEVSKNKKKYFVLVTELMTSGTLRSYVRRLKRLNSKILKSWCRQILKGLSFLHSRKPPIIHRDLKCDNIFVTGTTGIVKIGDLGLATLKNRSFAKSIIGTPEFMAPEMYEEHYDERVDIYAFGMCILELLTNEYPYSECNGPAQIYKKVSAGEKPNCYKKIAESEIKSILDQCIKWDKNDRPFVQDLLSNEFFVEDVGMKLDILGRKEAVANDSSIIEFQLQITDQKKQNVKYKGNEAVQFRFELEVDNPEEIAVDMANVGFIFADDVRLMSQMIFTQLLNLKRDREQAKRAEIYKNVAASFDLSALTKDMVVHKGGKKYAHKELMGICKKEEESGSRTKRTDRQASRFGDNNVQPNANFVYTSDIDQMDKKSDYNQWLETERYSPDYVKPKLIKVDSTLSQLAYFQQSHPSDECKVELEQRVTNEMKQTQNSRQEFQQRQLNQSHQHMFQQPHLITSLQQAPDKSVQSEIQSPQRYYECNRQGDMLSSLQSQTTHSQQPSSFVRQQEQFQEQQRAELMQKQEIQRLTNLQKQNQQQPYLTELEFQQPVQFKKQHSHSMQQNQQFSESQRRTSEVTREQQSQIPRQYFQQQQEQHNESEMKLHHDFQSQTHHQQPERSVYSQQQRSRPLQQYQIQEDEIYKSKDRQQSMEYQQQQSQQPNRQQPMEYQLQQQQQQQIQSQQRSFHSLQEQQSFERQKQKSFDQEYSPYHQQTQHSLEQQQPIQFQQQRHLFQRQHSFQPEQQHHVTQQLRWTPSQHRQSLNPFQTQSQRPEQHQPEEQIHQKQTRSVQEDNFSHSKRSYTPQYNLDHPRNVHSIKNSFDSYKGNACVSELNDFHHNSDNKCPYLNDTQQGNSVNNVKPYVYCHNEQMNCFLDKRTNDIPYDANRMSGSSHYGGDTSLSCQSPNQLTSPDRSLGTVFSFHGQNTGVQPNSFNQETADPIHGRRNYMNNANTVFVDEMNHTPKLSRQQHYSTGSSQSTYAPVQYKNATNHVCCEHCPNKAKSANVDNFPDVQFQNRDLVTCQIPTQSFDRCSQDRPSYEETQHFDNMQSQKIMQFERLHQNIRQYIFQQPQVELEQLMMSLLYKMQEIKQKNQYVSAQSAQNLYYENRNNWSPSSQRAQFNQKMDQYAPRTNQYTQQSSINSQLTDNYRSEYMNQPTTTGHLQQQSMRDAQNQEGYIFEQINQPAHHTQQMYELNDGCQQDTQNLHHGECCLLNQIKPKTDLRVPDRMVMQPRQFTQSFEQTMQPVQNINTANQRCQQNQYDVPDYSCQSPEQREPAVQPCQTCPCCIRKLRMLQKQRDVDQQIGSMHQIPQRMPSVESLSQRSSGNLDTRSKKISQDISYSDQTELYAQQTNQNVNYSRQSFQQQPRNDLKQETQPLLSTHKQRTVQNLPQQMYDQFDQNIRPSSCSQRSKQMPSYQFQQQESDEQMYQSQYWEQERQVQTNLHKKLDDMQTLCQQQKQEHRKRNLSENQIHNDPSYSVNENDFGGSCAPQNDFGGSCGPHENVTFDRYRLIPDRNLLQPTDGCVQESTKVGIPKNTTSATLTSTDTITCTVLPRVVMSITTSSLSSDDTKTVTLCNDDAINDKSLIDNRSLLTNGNASKDVLDFDNINNNNKNAVDGTIIYGEFDDYETDRNRNDRSNQIDHDDDVDVDDHLVSEKDDRVNISTAVATSSDNRSIADSDCLDTIANWSLRSQPLLFGHDQLFVNNLSVAQSVPITSVDMHAFDDSSLRRNIDQLNVINFVNNENDNNNNTTCISNITTTSNINNNDANNNNNNNNNCAINNNHNNNGVNDVPNLTPNLVNSSVCAICRDLDSRRKISVISNQSNMSSADSDYVSDTNNTLNTIDSLLICPYSSTVSTAAAFVVDRSLPSTSESNDGCNSNSNNSSNNNNTGSGNVVNLLSTGFSTDNSSTLDLLLRPIRKISDISTLSSLSGDSIGGRGTSSDISVSSASTITTTTTDTHNSNTSGLNVIDFKTDDNTTIATDYLNGSSSNKNDRIIIDDRIRSFTSVTSDTIDTTTTTTRTTSTTTALIDVENSVGTLENRLIDNKCYTIYTAAKDYFQPQSDRVSLITQRISLTSDQPRFRRYSIANSAGTNRVSSVNYKPSSTVNIIDVLRRQLENLNKGSLVKGKISATTSKHCSRKNSAVQTKEYNDYDYCSNLTIDNNIFSGHSPNNNDNHIYNNDINNEKSNTNNELEQRIGLDQSASIVNISGNFNSPSVDVVASRVDDYDCNLNHKYSMCYPLHRLASEYYVSTGVTCDKDPFQKFNNLEFVPPTVENATNQIEKTSNEAARIDNSTVADPIQPIITYKILDDDLTYHEQFKLIVLNLNGTFVECKLNSANKSIAFCLDVGMVPPAFAANSLISAELLCPNHFNRFVAYLEIILSELKKHKDGASVALLNGVIDEYDIELSRNEEITQTESVSCSVLTTDDDDDKTAIEEPYDKEYESLDTFSEEIMKADEEISEAASNIYTATTSDEISCSGNVELPSEDASLGTDLSRDILANDVNSDATDIAPSCTDTALLNIPISGLASPNNTIHSVDDRHNFSLMCSSPQTIADLTKKLDHLNCDTVIIHDYGEPVFSPHDKTDSSSNLPFKVNYETFSQHLQQELAGISHGDGGDENNGIFKLITDDARLSNSATEIFPTSANTANDLDGMTVIPSDSTPILVRPIAIEPIFYANTSNNNNNLDCKQSIPPQDQVKSLPDGFKVAVGQPVFAHPIPGEPVMVQKLSNLKTLRTETCTLKRVPAVHGLVEYGKLENNIYLTTKSDKKSRIGDIKILDEELSKIHKPKKDAPVSLTSLPVSSEPKHITFQINEEVQTNGEPIVRNKIDDKLQMKSEEKLKQNDDVDPSLHRPYTDSSISGRSSSSSDVQFEQTVNNHHQSIYIGDLQLHQDTGDIQLDDEIDADLQQAIVNKSVSSPGKKCVKLEKGRFSVMVMKNSSNNNHRQTTDILENVDDLSGDIIQNENYSTDEINKFSDDGIVIADGNDVDEDDEEQTITAEDNAGQDGDDVVALRTASSLLHEEIPSNVVPLIAGGQMMNGKSDACPTEEMRALLERQQMELEIMQRQHQSEIKGDNEPDDIKPSTSGRVLTKPALFYQALSPISYEEIDVDNVFTGETNGTGDARSNEYAIVGSTSSATPIATIVTTVNAETNSTITSDAASDEYAIVSSTSSVTPIATIVTTVNAADATIATTNTKTTVIQFAPAGFYFEPTAIRLLNESDDANNPSAYTDK